MRSEIIKEAFKVLEGPSAVARILAGEGISITPWAVNKWLRAGRLPRTEYTGETQYADVIARACRQKDPATRITREALLDLPCPPDSAAVANA